MGNIFDKMLRLIIGYLHLKLHLKFNNMSPVLVVGIRNRPKNDQREDFSKPIFEDFIIKTDHT